MTAPSWYYRHDDVVSGPVSFTALAALLAAGTIGPDSPVWTEEWREWRRAADFPELHAAAEIAAPSAASEEKPEEPEEYPLTGRPSFREAFRITQLALGAFTFLVLSLAFAAWGARQAVEPVGLLFAFLAGPVLVTLLATYVLSLPVAGLVYYCLKALSRR